MLIRTTVVDTRTGLELRIEPVDEPGRILARVSRTDRFVADDVPAGIASIVRLMAGWAAGMFAAGDYDAVRAIVGRAPAGEHRPVSPRTRRRR